MSKNDSQIEELFNAKAHLGHKSNRVHPKAKKYIYTIENGVSIIDLTQTVVQLEKAKQIIKELQAAGKTLVFVATKKIAADFVKNICQENNLFSVTVKWPAGFLTNFEMINRNMKKLNQMKKEKEAGDWNKFVKHEQVKLSKELSRLEKFFGGIAGLTKMPDALFIIDTKKEKNAVKEAHQMHIPVIALSDTNVNPELVDYPIVGNDDSLSSVEYFVKDIINACKKEEK